LPTFGQPPQGNPFGQPVQQNPFGQAVPQNPFGQPQNGQGLFVPIQPPQTQPSFGVIGSPTPGTVQQPVQPGVRPRPQG
jgi:hypothetical protein